MIPHDLAGRRTCLAPFDALLQVLDVAAGEAGGLDGFVQDVADFHAVVNLQRLCDDVRAVPLFTDDAGADRVAVHTDQEVEKRRAVKDHKLLVGVHDA